MLIVAAGTALNGFIHTHNMTERTTGMAGDRAVQAAVSFQFVLSRHHASGTPPLRYLHLWRN